jgi:hypothetical protein
MQNEGLAKELKSSIERLIFSKRNRQKRLYWAAAMTGSLGLQVGCSLLARKPQFDLHRSPLVFGGGWATSG